MKIISATGRGIAQAKRGSELPTPENKFDVQIKELRALLKKVSAVEAEKIQQEIESLQLEKVKSKRNKESVVEYQMEKLKSFSVVAAYPTAVIERHIRDDQVIDVYKVAGIVVGAYAGEKDEIVGKKNPLYEEKLSQKKLEKLLKTSEPVQTLTLNTTYVLSDGKENYLYEVNRMGPISNSYIYKQLADNKQYHAQKYLASNIESLLDTFYSKLDKKEKLSRLQNFIAVITEKSEFIKKNLPRIAPQLESVVKDLKQLEQQKSVYLGKEISQKLEDIKRSLEEGYSKILAETIAKNLKKDMVIEIERGLLLRSLSINGPFNELSLIPIEDLKNWIKSMPKIAFATTIDVVEPTDELGFVNYRFVPAAITTQDGQVKFLSGFNLNRDIFNSRLYDEKRYNFLKKVIPANFDLTKFEEFMYNIKDRKNFYTDYNLPRASEIKQDLQEFKIEKIPPFASYTKDLKLISSSEPVFAKLQKEKERDVKKEKAQNFSKEVSSVVEDVANELSKTQERLSLVNPDNTAEDLTAGVYKKRLQEVKKQVLKMMKEEEEQNKPRL